MQAPHEILKRHFERKKERRPSYSLRALARDLDISPAQISRILNGKRGLSTEMIDRMIGVLDIENVDAAELGRSILVHSSVSKKVDENMVTELPSKNIPLKYEDAPPQYLNLFKKWYYFAVLNLVEVEDFELDFEKIALRLGLKKEQVVEAWDLLLEIGCVQVKDERWVRKKVMVAHQNTKSSETKRQYYKDVLTKAIEALEQTGQEDFEKRLINGGTLAVNSENLKKGMNHINRSIGEAIQIMQEGPKDQVYQISLAIFPYTKG
jgi:uncharacterized protein (TIGR02147 family)